VSPTRTCHTVSLQVFLLCFRLCVCVCVCMCVCVSFVLKLLYISGSSGPIICTRNLGRCAIAIAYAVNSGYPFSTYGETVFILIQSKWQCRAWMWV
jgi:hypothetical protein